MEGGFQTNKEAEYDEEVAIVLLPSMQKIEVTVKQLHNYNSVITSLMLVCVDR